MFYFLIMWVFVDVNLSCKTIWVLLFPSFSKTTSAIPVSKKEEQKRSVGRWRWTVKHPAGKRSPQFLAGGFLQMFCLWIFTLKTWGNHPSWWAYFPILDFNHQLDFGHANKARLTILVIYDISWPPFVRRGKLWVCHPLLRGKDEFSEWKNGPRESLLGLVVDRSLGGYSPEI